MVTAGGHAHNHSNRQSPGLAVTARRPRGSSARWPRHDPRRLVAATNRVAVPALPGPCRRATTRCASNSPTTAAFLSNEVAAVRAGAGWSSSGRTFSTCRMPQVRSRPAPDDEKREDLIAVVHDPVQRRVVSATRSDEARRHRPFVVMPSAHAAEQLAKRAGDHSIGPTRRAPLVDDVTPPAASLVTTRASSSPSAANGSMAGRLPMTPSEITSPSL